MSCSIREQLQTETINRRVMKGENHRLKQQENKERISFMISEGIVFSFTSW